MRQESWAVGVALLGGLTDNLTEKLTEDMVEACAHATSAAGFHYGQLRARRTLRRARPLVAVRGALAG
jgi:hypothetical protein